jgi:hypothetical protein
VILSEHRVHLELARAIESIGSDVECVGWSARFPEELSGAEIVELD